MVHFEVYIMDNGETIHLYPKEGSRELTEEPEIHGSLDSMNESMIEWANKGKEIECGFQ